MYALILNPSSGSGRALRELPRIEALLEQEQVEYRVDSADKPGDLRAFAARAVEEGLEGIIALGGDGTLFEILNGMARSDLTLLLACCGTGNDFSRLFRLPNDPVEALRMQLHLPLSRIDIGRMNEFYFLNVAGTGLMWKCWCKRKSTNSGIPVLGRICGVCGMRFDFFGRQTRA